MQVSGVFSEISYGNRAGGKKYMKIAFNKLYLFAN